MLLKQDGKSNKLQNAVDIQKKYICDIYEVLYAYRIAPKFIHKCYFYLDLKSLNNNHLKYDGKLIQSKNSAGILENSICIQILTKYRFTELTKKLNVGHFETKEWIKVTDKFHPKKVILSMAAKNNL